MSFHSMKSRVSIGAWTLTKLTWSAWYKCYVGAGRRVEVGH